MAVFCKQMKMSSTKLKEIGFSFKHARSCNSCNNNHNNNSKMTIVLLRRSKVLVVTPAWNNHDLSTTQTTSDV